ncbi:MAG: hypothetical protein AAGF20_05140 [Pseudomonadota bacterium]
MTMTGIDIFIAENQNIILLLSGLVLLYILYRSRRNPDGRWDDRNVTTEKVLQALEGFEAEREARLKHGFTERSLQMQIKSWLNNQFENVDHDSGLASINGLKIDLDIGRGKVGIELKLARELFKTAHVQRLVGQIDDYLKAYNSEDLLLVVGITAEEVEDRVWVNEVEDRMASKEVQVVWLDLP